MVKLEDGFKEKEIIREKNSLVYDIAVSMFGISRVSATKGEDYVAIYAVPNSIGIANISCGYRLIHVIYESHYEECLRLAKELEKQLGKEFTLRTEYNLEK